MLMLLRTAVSVCAGKQTAFFSSSTWSVYVASVAKERRRQSPRVALKFVSLRRRRGRAAGEARYETQGGARAWAYLTNTSTPREPGRQMIKDGTGRLSSRE